MKQSALAFALFMTLFSACSTVKSNATASEQARSNAARPSDIDTKTEDRGPKTITTKSGKVMQVQEGEGKMLNTSERTLVRKKPEKTMEQMFDAATGKRDSL
jgi:Cu/Ag efflux protein CusF